MTFLYYFLLGSFLKYHTDTDINISVYQDINSSINHKYKDESCSTLFKSYTLSFLIE